MPWGVGWGGSPWGDGSGSPPVPPAGFYVVSAIAVASNVVRVTFSQNPVIQSPLGAGDAANLNNWTVVLTEDSSELTILAARAVSGDPTSIELVMLKPWKSAHFTYEVRAENLVSTAASSLTDPKTALFQGLPISETVLGGFQGVLIDIGNAQTSETSINGALNVLSSGDYQLESGLPLLKKLIVRRLTTADGEFLHLTGQDYGLGLTPSALYTPSDLVRLKVDVERQVLREPEVSAVAARCSLTRDGQLTVELKAVLRRTGQEFAFSLPLNQGGTYNLEF